MKCPKCKNSNFALFNEKQEITLKRFDDLAMSLFLIGFILTLAAGVPFLVFLTESGFNIAAFIFMLIGLLLLLLFVIKLFFPQKRTTYKVKVVCKDCGYQFFLTQDNIKNVKLET